MKDSLEQQSRKLFNIVNNKFLNKAYIAQELYDSKTAKRATSMFYQKMKGLSAMSEEDVLKLYDIVTRELAGITNDIKGLAEEMNEKHLEYQKKQFIESKMKEMTPEMFEKFKQAVEREFKKED